VSELEVMTELNEQEAKTTNDPTDNTNLFMVNSSLQIYCIPILKIFHYFRDVWFGLTFVMKDIIKLRLNFLHFQFYLKKVNPLLKWIGLKTLES
jgi:hypothetical protein